MRIWSPLALAFLLVYSLALMVIELRTSQDYVRHYFTDIQGPVAFYAINTTICVFFQWATALMFMVSLACLPKTAESRRLRLFCYSQVLMFTYLGFDDRFMFHEKVSNRLGIDDHYILLAAAALEVFFLWRLAGAPVLRSRAGTYLALGVLFFGIMLFIDACLPHEMVLRLSLEDLAKMWGTVFFFRFAWEVFCQQIDRLRPSQ